VRFDIDGPKRGLNLHDQRARERLALLVHQIDDERFRGGLPERR
jgi:hypothetical protein